MTVASTNLHALGSAPYAPKHLLDINKGDLLVKDILKYGFLYGSVMDALEPHHDI